MLLHRSNSFSKVGSANRTRLQARRPNQESELTPDPKPSSCSISTFSLRVKITGLDLHDSTPISGKAITHTVGVWGRTTKAWVVAPMSCKVEDGASGVTDMVHLMVPASEISDADLVLKVTTKKLLSVHDIGSCTIPLLQNVGADGGVETVSLNSVLTKQGSKNNPNNRGTVNLEVGMKPLTYVMDGPSLFSMLPHDISMWVIAVVKPEDTTQSGEGMTCLRRFREFALSVQNQDDQMKVGGVFYFGEVPFTAAQHGRLGTRVAMGIDDDNNSFGNGKVIANIKCQKLTVCMRQRFESEIAHFIKPYRDPANAQSVWKKAVEAMQQLNPCRVVDLFVETDSSDFDRITLISRLIVEVSDVLSTGTPGERAAALRTLAIDAPQALCLAALNVPHDDLLRELEGVIYEVDTGKPGESVADHTESFLRKRFDSSNSGSLGSGRDLWPLDVSGGGSSDDALGSTSPTLRSSWTASPSTKDPTSSSTTGRFKNFFSRSGGKTGSSSPKISSPIGPIGLGSVKTPDNSGKMLHEQDIDETWHGTRVDPADVANMEVSDVPRYGTLKPRKEPGTEQKIPKNIRAVQGSVAALEVMATVLGKDFLTKICIPCILSESSDEAECAKAIGKIYFSARCSGIDTSSLVLRLEKFAKHGTLAIRVNAVESIGVVAKYSDDENAQELAVYVATSEKDPKVLEKLIEILPSIMSHNIKGKQQKEMLKYSTPSRKGGTTAIPPRLYRKRLSTVGPHTGAIQLQDTFPSGKAVSIFSDAIISLASASKKSEDAGHWSNTDTVPDDISKRCFDAALEMTKCIGLERWDELQNLWKYIVGNQNFNKNLAGGIHSLCRILCPKNFDDVSRAGAPESAHNLIIDCLQRCLELPSHIISDPTKEIKVNSWVWKQVEMCEENVNPSLMTNLPFILASIPPESRRPEWLYVMQSMFRGILASRRILVAGSTWDYSEGADTILIDNTTIDVRRLEIKLDASTLAYQFPAAVALGESRQVLWTDAHIVHQAISEDDEPLLRWMVARSLHVCPRFFPPEIIPRLAGMMNKLIHDTELDVAEAAHKDYMEFVAAVADLNPTIAVEMGTIFFDDYLWSRRNHFEIYRAEQLVALIKMNIPMQSNELIIQKCIDLLSHRCIEVRKQAAASSAEIIDFLGESSPHEEKLKNVVLDLGKGTCRQKQTFIWTCEQMMILDHDYYLKNFSNTLKSIAEKDTRDADRSVVHHHAWMVLTAQPMVKKGDTLSRRTSSGPPRPERKKFTF